MGNSQSYDVTNVHHRNDKHQDQATAGTVKPLRDDMPPTLGFDEHEKQENESPRHERKGSHVLSKSVEQEDAKEQVTSAPPPQPCAFVHQKSEDVEEVAQAMSNVALETLHRDVPQETIPLETAPSQSSYDKLD